MTGLIEELSARVALSARTALSACAARTALPARATLAIVVALAACAALTPRASADSTPQFLESAMSTTLPTNPALTSSIGFALGSTSCWSAGSCVSVGYYSNAAGTDVYPLIVPIDNGIPGPGVLVRVALPGQAQASAADGRLDAVSCAPTGTCEAVGWYIDASGNNVPMVAQIVDGVAAAAVPVSLPSDAISSGQSAVLQSVSCAPTGTWCEATGYYSNALGQAPLTVSISNGAAGAGTGVTLPNDADTSVQGAQLTSVSCPASGSCEAVGYYEDSSTRFVSLLVPISNGIAGKGSTVALPSNAEVTNQTSHAEHVSCWSAGSCVAVGYYSDGSNRRQLMTVPISGGVAGSGVEITVPANGVASPLSDFGGLSCSSTGACAAVGNYGDASGDEYPLAVTISNGVAGSATEVSLPANAETGSQSATLNDVSCESSGVCVAAGGYEVSANDFESMTATVAGGTVSGASEAPAPPDHLNSAPANALESLACASSGSCVAVGQEVNAASHYLPYVVSMQMPLSLTPPQLPSGGVGVAYSATLAASGAWGSYGWSVAAGSLPPGLSLNAQTGVLSGIPAQAGTSTFTVEATGTGAPKQTATETLSLEVSAARVRIVSHLVQVRENRLTLKLSCSQAPCAGVVKLEVRRRVLLRHGKRHVQRERLVVIGSARFSIAAGRTGGVRLALNRSGRAALAGAAPHRLGATAIASAQAAKPVSAHVTLWTAAHKRHKR